MKNYKLVNSKEAREKASRLGLEQVKCYPEEPFMLVYDGIYRTMCDNYGFTTCDFQEITQADFLALPEPFRVGDWVKCDNRKGSHFISSICEVKADRYIVKFNNAEWYIEELTKLTQQQIDILELN